MKTSIFLKAIFLASFLIIQTTTFSQVNVRNLYLNDKKTLFVKDSLPVYFFISESPDGSNPIKLQSSSPHANPMYFDGHGNHFIYHKDNFLEEEVRFDFQIDGLAPITDIEISSDNKYLKGGKIYLSKDARIALKSHDGMSGLSKLFHSIDGAPYTEYKDAINLDKEKTYTYSYYAMDMVGNVEVVNTKYFITDFNAPISNHTVKGQYIDNILASSATISLASIDEVSGLKKIIYKLDGKQEFTYTNAISLYNLAEGEHKIEYYAIDNVNNKELIKEYAFYVDKTAPMVVEEITGNSFVAGGREYASGRSQLKLTAIDNKAGVKDIFYSLKGEAYQKYEQAVYLTTSGGSLNIKSYAVDNVGNVSTGNIEGAKSTIPYVDLTGPNLNYSFQGITFKARDTVFANPETKIVLKGFDNESGLQKITYTIDNASEQTYTTPFNIPKSGICHVKFTGYDNVGNSNNTGFYFKVDNTGPEFYYRFSTLPVGKTMVNGKSIDVYPDFVMLFLSSTDAEVGSNKIFYKLNADSEKTYSTYIQGFTKGKSYKVKVRATDLLGNQVESEFEFAIEK